MSWTDNSSRAVVPSTALKVSDVPMLGNRTIATSSPFPLGLGVYQRNENGVEMAQNLFYVSPTVAKSRGRGVVSGWYVIATPGAEFTLRLTNVHEHWRGSVALNSKRGACAEIIVDGVNPLGGTMNKCGSYRVSIAGREIVIPGFNETVTYGNGQYNGTAIVRQFQYQKKDTCEGEEVEEDDSTGSMVMRIYTGPFKSRTPLGFNTMSKLSGTAKVEEKSAVKFGRSVLVGRKGKQVLHTYHRVMQEVVKEKLDAVVNIYIREKFWLESRSIIDSDGNAFKPNRDRKAIILENENESDGVSTQKKRSDKIKVEVIEVDAVQAVGNKRRSLKFEQGITKTPKLEVRLID